MGELLGEAELLGAELERAARRLSDAGVAFSVVETKPTRGTPPEGAPRVVRVRRDPVANRTELTVCRV